MNIVLGVVTALCAASFALVSVVIATALAMPIFARATDRRARSL